ncbi:26S proteasome complex ubiquitin receptor, subunit Rpn13 family-containing protein [Strongyloides ratti]|uniref:26S proteasome complex ubiquitin receptor, subunit Rpn13 family-containing protein n=1 Tax=Strongyloides ratti TaxID=34506 RepID=A0A090L230_STRRB|nr:26S proteasome complex ubiquitin receptor, subunit Rpn13 family-containing protein [Strongyloides ratti]CEF63722.1 26S proteasome complex ubiquitin receptor, subunit Rpn13 family-containing protein [Strongyloides ratti]
MSNSGDLPLSPVNKGPKTIISDDDSLHNTSINEGDKLLKYKKTLKKKFILFHESPQVLRPNRHMYSIKAGRTRVIKNITQTNKAKLVCNPTPGIIRFKVDSKGSLLLTWENRITRKREFECKPTPSTCTFKKVGECNDGFVVIFQDTINKDMEFFWIQENDPETVDNFLPKVNKILKMDK